MHFVLRFLMFFVFKRHFEPQAGLVKTRGQAIASLTAPLPWFRCLARGDRAGARGDKKCTFEMHAEHEYTMLCAWHHPCGTLHPLFARTPAQAFTPGFKPFKMFITLHMPCHLFFFTLHPHTAQSTSI